MEIGLVLTSDERLKLVADQIGSKMSHAVGVHYQIDGTFRLIDEGLPLLILVIQDARGKFHQFAWCVCSGERATCVSRFVTAVRFVLWKKHNVDLKLLVGKTFWGADGGYALRLGVQNSFVRYPEMASVQDKSLDELLKVGSSAAGSRDRLGEAYFERLKLCHVTELTQPCAHVRGCLAIAGAGSAPWNRKGRR